MRNLKGERWADVVGFEGLYEISTAGRLKSRKPVGKPTTRVDKIIKGGLSKTGYMYVQLRADKKSYPKAIHILVAEAFLGYEADKGVICVDHKNTDKLDNRVENLQIISHRQNLSKDRVNSFGYRGVSKPKLSTGYVALFGSGSKNLYLGMFDTPEEAGEAYQKQLKRVAV